MDHDNDKDVTQHDLVSPAGAVELTANSERSYSPSRRIRHLRVVFLGCIFVLALGWTYLSLRLDWTKSSHDGPSQEAYAQVDILDGRHVPGGSHDSRGRKRLVFVGDIHACSYELHALLQAVRYDKERDHLIHTGDIIGKGPGPRDVIDTLISLGASGVRGNWDNRVLDALDQAHNGAGGQTRTNKQQRMVEAVAAMDLKAHHIRYLRSMPHVLRIPSLPSTAESRAAVPLVTQPNSTSHSALRIQARDRNAAVVTEPVQSSRHETLPKLRSPGGIVVAHAGLVPSVALQDQRPKDVMNMRWIDSRTLETSARQHIGPLWSSLWNDYNQHLARSSDDPDISAEARREARKGDGDVESGGDWSVAAELVHKAGGGQKHTWGKALQNGAEKFLAAYAREMAQDLEEEVDTKHHEPVVAVYGHNSKVGVTVERWSVGLDGGCVRGGQLVALTLDARGRRELVRVDCEQYVK